MIQETFLTRIFYSERQKPLTHRRNSKYDSDQAGRTGTPEYSDVREGEITKLPEGKR